MKVSNSNPRNNSKSYQMLRLGCVLTFIGPILLVFFATEKNYWVIASLSLITICGISLVVYSWHKLKLNFSKLVEAIFYYGVS